jgi:hypothetical protein
MTSVIQTDFAGVTLSTSFDGAGGDSISDIDFSYLEAHFDYFSTKLMPGNQGNLDFTMPSHESIVANGDIRPAKPGCANSY